MQVAVARVEDVRDVEAVRRATWLAIRASTCARWRRGIVPSMQ